MQLQASHTAALTQIDGYGAQVPPVRPTYIFALARPRSPAPLMHRSARLSGVLAWTPPVRTALSGRFNDGWCATGLASLRMALRGFAGPCDTSATWHVPRLKAQCDASTCNMQHQVAGRSRRSRGSLTHSTHGSQPSPPTLMAYIGSGAPRSRPYMRWSSTKAGRMPTQSASSRHSSSRPVRLTAQYLLCSALLCSALLCSALLCSAALLCSRPSLCALGCISATIMVIWSVGWPQWFPGWSAPELGADVCRYRRAFPRRFPQDHREHRQDRRAVGQGRL